MIHHIFSENVFILCPEVVKGMNGYITDCAHKVTFFDTKDFIIFHSEMEDLCQFHPNLIKVVSGSLLNC